MNAEEVCKMIDTIYGCETYNFELEPGITLAEFKEVDIAIRDQNGNVRIIPDPRTARELAGALVAWASRRETQNKLDRSLNRILGGE